MDVFLLYGLLRDQQKLLTAAMINMGPYNRDIFHFCHFSYPFFINWPFCSWCLVNRRRDSTIHDCLVPRTQKLSLLKFWKERGGSIERNTHWRKDIFGEKTSTPSMSVYRCCCCGKSSPIFYWQISLSFFTNFFFGRDWEGKEDATRRVNCVTFVGPLPPPDATMLVFICRGFYFFEKLSAHDTTPPYSHLGSRLRILFNKSSAGIIIWWA